jgi:hypothetical protein
MGAAVRPVGVSVPLDEETLMVELHGPPNPAASTLECRVTPLGTDGGAASASPLMIAWQSLAPVLVRAVSGAPGRVVVEGSGFGPTRRPDDGVWLVPASGSAVMADHACKEAVWSDGHIVACAPRGILPHPYQVRVESAGRLGLGPAWP